MGMPLRGTRRLPGDSKSVSGCSFAFESQDEEQDPMGRTLVEKILGTHTEREVRVGDFAVVRVDFSYVQDGTGPGAYRYGKFGSNCMRCSMKPYPTRRTPWSVPEAKRKCGS